MFRQLSQPHKALSGEVCISLLKQEMRGVLSLIGDNGYPYGIPIDHWYCQEDGCIYFHSGPAGHKVDALRKCEKASFCVYDRGYREEGDWALHIRSVIVFGHIEIIADNARAIDLTRQLSLKYTRDLSYIEEEIRRYGDAVLVFRLVPEHMTGKLVKES